MMINNKLKITMLAFGMFFLAGVSSVRAADTEDEVDYANGLSTAPRAITMNGLFQRGTGTGVTTSSDMVNMDMWNRPTTNSKDVVKTLVRITNDKAQKAAIWSTDDNSFDINKDGKASMWVYLGNRGNGAGDGMALVFQNDPKGNAAISGNSGETLGVWGDDLSANVLSSAIQNSWALEFDTYMNGGTNNGGAFDLNLPGRSHLASGYPADAGTYKGNGFLNKYYTQNHTGLITYNDSLSNGKWHHLTIDYTTIDAKTGSMTYTFDDKEAISEYNGSKFAPAEYEGQTQKVSIDKTKFKSTSGKIRWGFTGSTGSNSESNLVMFEQVPGLVDAKATQTVTNLTQGKDLPSDGTGVVNAGDKLKFTSKATYLGGKQAWKEPAAYAKYPLKNIDWTGIFLNGADTGLTDPADAVVGASIAGGGDLSTPNSTGEITYFGTVKSIAEDSKDTSPAGQFIGSNAIANTNAVSYTVKGQPKILLTIDGLKDIDVNYGSDATVSGTVKSSLGGLLAKGAKVDVTVNNETTPIKADVGTDGKFSVTVPKDKYKAGENTVTVQATDAAGIQTVKYTNKINIHPVLTLNDNNGTVIAPYTFNFQVVDNSADITTYYKEGASGTPVQLEKYANTKPGSTQDHKVDLDTSKLSIGTHVLTVYSVDTEGNTSNNQTITVIVGLLSISSDDSINFKNQIPAKTSVLSRTADYTLKLETSAAKNWTLSVTAGALTAKSDNSTLQHSTVGFRDTKDKSFTPLSPTIGTTIDSGTGQVATITKKWATDAGILLNVVPSEIKADEVYTSQVKWTLTNTPVN
ncbi:cell surface protein [Dellaglioa algida]|nr:cell surface protein [Dellaglioa algida]